MNEKEEINRAAKIQAAMESGEMAPGRVQKVSKDENGNVSFSEISPSVVKAAAGLRKARSGSGLSQREFAEILGVPLSTYRNYEQYITPTPKAVLKLAILASADPEMVRMLAV